MWSSMMFVGGISWNTSEAGLREAFERYGEVTEATVVTDRETGRSRGFGFVVFSNPDEADKAMSEMDGTELDGRVVRVNEAHDKRRGGGGGGGGRGAGYGDRSW